VYIDIGFDATKLLKDLGGFSSAFGEIQRSDLAMPFP
jgi:hypothetical protein